MEGGTACLGVGGAVGPPSGSPRQYASAPARTTGSSIVSADAFWASSSPLTIPAYRSKISWAVSMLFRSLGPA